VLNVQVGSQISGNIAKLFADYNSIVKSGQVVAQIDPSTYKATLMQAEGDLASARAALELARANERRARELRAQNATPQLNLDQAVATLHQAEASLKMKEGALAQARVNLDRCTITSPVDGIVISRNVDVGQTVAASLSAPVLFTIANDLTKMQINSNVAEADVGVVEVGQDVDFTVDAFPDRTFHGNVTQVRNAPITVQNVVTYDAVIGVSNDELKLKPGMTANVSIIIARRQDVLKIPNAALRYRPAAESNTSPRSAWSPRPVRKRDSRQGQTRPAGERMVHVLRDEGGEPEATEITTGISDSVFTEVKEGLSEGVQVVISRTGKAAATPPSSNPLGGGMRRF
jgi:HlyD family secretion protein